MAYSLITAIRQGGMLLQTRCWEGTDDQGLIQPRMLLVRLSITCIKAGWTESVEPITACGMVIASKVGRFCCMKRAHRMLVLLLLLAYSGTATAVMPAVFAGLAVLDGSHRVMICRSEQGMEVRLHHRENDYTPEVCDHAGLLAQLVVSFCRPAAEGDHSLTTNQVTGTLTNPGDDAKRFINDSVEAVNLDDRQARVTLKMVFKAVRWDFRSSSGVALQEIATVRMLI